MPLPFPWFSKLPLSSVSLTLSTPPQCSSHLPRDSK
uniref:Uncharacterized protein n=1 Tax=Brassica oleracea TaxID=3712 RepID=A0A3P6G9T9_BRAOL|nr:unnamed protein product [Brassica oleracea]